MDIRTLVAERVAFATDLRRRLHRIPEVAYQEFKTAELIRATLTELGISFVAGVEGAPTATIGLLGDAAKPCIAFRADIDALPIEEQTGLDYASTHPGRMHACGHDGHTATLIAAAAVLTNLEASLPVCVKLIFQPAEEGGAGAARLVEAGVLDGRVGPKVQTIHGLHGSPGMPVGTIGSRPGPLHAATDNFRATFTGLGCHGAMPHLGRDPIVAAAEAVLSLQQIVAREVDPTQPAVVTVGVIQGGTAVNIIPDTAIIRGTCRSASEPIRQLLRAAVRRRCEHVAAASNCTCEVTVTGGYPATNNNEALVVALRQIVADTFGPQAYYAIPAPGTGGEDFAFYQEKVPGCFFRVGLRPAHLADYPSLHSDHFDFNDDAIALGATVFAAVALRGV